MQDPDRQNLGWSGKLFVLYDIKILAKLCFGPASFRSYFEDCIPLVEIKVYTLKWDRIYAKHFKI